MFNNQQEAKNCYESSNVCNFPGYSIGKMMNSVLINVMEEPYGR